MALTLITPKNDTPFLINSSTLAMVLHHAANPSDSNSKKTIRFFDRYRGYQQRHYYADDQDADIEAVLSALKQDRCELFPLSLVFAGQDSGTAWLSPNAFQSVVTGKLKPGKNGNDQTINIILDIEGYGQIQTEATPQDLDLYMAAVTKVKPGLVKITSDIAKAGSMDGYIVFDPRQVESIRSGYQEQIHIGMNGSGRMAVGRIDCNLNSGDPSGNSLNHVVLTRMAKKYRSLLKLDLEKDDNFNLLCLHAYDYTDKLSVKLKEKFAAMVAGFAPQLVQIPLVKTGPVYVDPDRLESVYMNNQRVAFHLIRPSHIISFNDVMVDFEHASEARTALESFSRLAAQRPALRHDI